MIESCVQNLKTFETFDHRHRNQFSSGKAPAAAHRSALTNLPFTHLHALQ